MSKHFDIAGRTLAALLILLPICFGGLARAEDKELEQSIGTIHKIDMTDDRPKAPTFILVMMDMKRTKVSGATGHSIVRQFTKRCRIDFNGSGLPKGRYTLAVASSCKAGSFAAPAYHAAVTQLHEFDVVSTHVATEKSLPKASLREPGKGNLVLEGKALMLFHSVKNKFEMIDCQRIQ